MNLSDEEINKLWSESYRAPVGQMNSFRHGYRAAESRLLPFVEANDWRKYDPKDESTWPKDGEMILAYLGKGRAIDGQYFRRSLGINETFSFWQPAPPPPIDKEREAFEKAIVELGFSPTDGLKKNLFELWLAARKEGK